MPEYKAVLARLTRTINVRAGRRWGCISQRRSSSAWVWPPPARTSS
jgi:hypothetical protein